MLLDDEAVAFAFQLAALRLLRLREVAFLVVGLDVERNLADHGLAPASRRPFLWRGFLRRGLARRPLGRWGFCRWLLFRRFVVSAKALLQCGHQVDDIGALGRTLVRILDDQLSLLLALLGDEVFQ